MVRNWIVTAALAAATLVCANASNAAVVLGSVTGGTAAGLGGTFVQLSTSHPIFVGNNTLQSNDLFAFNEQQNITLTNALTVVNGDTTAQHASTVLAKGTKIDSHIVIFDPKLHQTIKGFVIFDTPILGIITTQAGLIGSNNLGLSNVHYFDPSGVGLEPGFDFVSLDTVNPYKLNVTLLSTDSPSDEIRVITQGRSITVVPEPSIWALMLVGFMLVGHSLRRRSAFKTSAV